MQSDYYSWSAAILLSLLLHSMLLLNGGAMMGADNVPVLQVPTITRLTFNQVVAKPVLDPPRPIEKKKIKPVKKIKPEPVPAKKQSQLVEQVPVVEPKRQVAAVPQSAGEQVINPTDGILERKRQQYLHELMKHIESFKYYPRAARRRAIEGNVTISLVLSGDGFYEQLELDGSPSILVKATETTLDSATPLPLPEDGVKLPKQIEFTMMYSLSD